MSENLIQITEYSTRGSFFLVTGQITALVVQAVAVFVVARLLGPDLYGIYALSLVLPGVLLLIVDLGMNRSIIRFSAYLRTRGQNKQIARIIRDVLFFKLAIGLILFGICFIFSDYFATNFLGRPDISFYVQLALTSIIVRVVVGTSYSIFVGLGRMELSALLISVQALAKAILSILLVIQGLGIIGVLIGYVVSYIIAGILSTTLLYFNIYKHRDSNEDVNTQMGGSWKDLLKILLNYGSPLYISALLLGIIPQLQSVILAKFTSDYNIGNFRASQNFVVLLSAVTIPIATSLFSAFSKFEKESKKVKTFFELSKKYVSVFVVPSTLLMIILSEEIIQIVYGTSYASASTYLSLHAMIFLLVGLGYQVQKSLFNGLGETRETLKISLIQFVFFIFLAPPLTMALEVTGLVISILAATIMATVYGAYRTKSKYKVKFKHKSLIHVYLLALVSATLAILCRRLLPCPPIFGLILTSAVYLISYLTLLPMTHTITKSELINMERVVKNIGPLKPIANLILKYEYAIIGN